MENLRRVAAGLFSRPYLLLLLTALFWGGNAVAGKAAVGVVPPMALTFLRWAIAGTVLLVVAREPLKRDWAAVRPRLVWFFAMGALGFAGFNILLYSSLYFTSAINVTLEQSAMPMIIVLLNFLAYREKISPAMGLGVVASLTGVAVIASHGDLAGLLRLNVNFGDALMLVAVVLYSGYSVALKAKPQIHWLSFLAVLSLSAAAASLPFLGYELYHGRMPVLSPLGLSLILYVALFPSFFAQLFYARGVELIGPNRAGLFINLVPVFGSLLAIALIGERIAGYHLVGYGLVVAGILVANRR